MTFGNNGWSQINKHASKKLDEVVKKIEASTMEEGIISFLDWGNKSDWKSFLQDTLLPLAENSGCLRALDIRSCKEPEMLFAGYIPRNKALSTLYDFTIWICFFLNEEGKKQVKKDILRIFGRDNELIDSRNKKLELTSPRLYIDNEKACIEASFLIGSSTWNLIPPVVHVIRPTEQECLRLIELIRMSILASI